MSLGGGRGSSVSCYFGTLHLCISPDFQLCSRSSTELCNQLDAQQAFCPFMGMPNEDDGLSDEAEIAAQMGRDVDEVERLMQKDIAENGIPLRMAVQL